MRGWYLRRAIPWIALLGCCAGALAAFALVSRWPDLELVLLPAMLGCCAAAAGFAFDEPAPALVAVTPRGAGWRRTTRLSAAAVPLLLWVLLVAFRPGEVSLTRSAWWLVGAAATLLVTGLAALADRHEIVAPGSSLAALVAVAVFTPVVVAVFLGWQSVYPGETVARSVTMFWSLVAALGLGCCVAALRPGLRA